jgi:hypothetical protein
MISFDKIAMSVGRYLLILVVGVALLGASLPCNCCKPLNSKTTSYKLTDSSPCHSHQSKSKNNKSSNSDNKSCCCTIANSVTCKMELATNVASEFSLKEITPPFHVELHSLLLVSNISLLPNHVRGSPLAESDLIVRSSTLPIRFQRLVI